MYYAMMPEEMEVLVGQPASANHILFEELYQEISKYPTREGISQVEIINLPSPLAAVFGKIIRQGSISERGFAADLNITAEQARQLAQLLVSKGYLTAVPADTGDEQTYQLNFNRQRSRRVPTDIWKKLDL